MNDPRLCTLPPAQCLRRGRRIPYRAAVVRPPSHFAGQTLGPLRLLRPLGHGGFAPVWLAEESFGGRRLRDVAVKLFCLPEDRPAGSAAAEQWYDSVADEARALCRVEHPNVVRFNFLQRSDELGVVGLAMEYVPGLTLERMLADAPHLDDRTVLEAGISISWALAAVHDAGLVHRDVKPANVIRGPTGYKLIDFGIFASIAWKTRGTSPLFAGEEQPCNCREPSGRSIPFEGGIAGTPGYIAPEYLYHGATPAPAGDLYALGAMLHQLLTGELPAGTNRQSSPPPMAVSAARTNNPDLLNLVRLLLEPDPLTRPHHADWVARQLERIRGWRTPASSPAPAPPQHHIASADGEFSLAPTARGPQGCFGAKAGAPQSQLELRLPPRLAGRNEALDMLRRAVEGMRSGQVHLVLLTGPMGIGRTRLLDAAVEGSDLSPARILRARCSPERRQPFGPLVEALGALPSAGASDLGLLLDALELAMSVARDAALCGGSTAPGGNALEALAGIEEALLEASTEAPLLWAIDDLQWADASTLQLLVRLAGRAGDAGKLLMVLTARDEPQPPAALHTLLLRAGQSMRPSLRRLRLPPLSRKDSLLLVAHAGPCSPELAQAIVQSAGGVPAFIVHALLAWRGLGAIVWREGAWRPAGERAVSEDVPGVADLLDARLAACLEPSSPAVALAHRALACVALHGGGLSLDLIFETLGKTPEVRAVLDTLIRANLLESAADRRTLGFAQEMMRQAALNRTRQALWFDDVHRALLDTIASRRSHSTDAAFLAAGYERLGDATKARRWFRVAVQRATAAGLFEEAATHGDRLAALTKSRKKRARVELDLVRAAIRGRAFEIARRRMDDMKEWTTGKPPAAQKQKASALDVERRILRLELARGLARGCANEPALYDKTLTADADALGDRRPACEARLAIAGVLPAREGLLLASEAVELAAHEGAALEYTARVRRLEINRSAGCFNLELADEDLHRALTIATTIGSVWHRIHIEGDLAIIEADLGQVDTAIGRSRRLAGEAEARRMRGQQRLLLQTLAALCLRTGRHEEAAEAAERAADLAASGGDPELRARALSVRADALLRLGRLEDALACVEQALRFHEELGDSKRALTLLRRAEIWEALGCVDAALADTRLARQVAIAHGETDLRLSARLLEGLILARRDPGNHEELAKAVAETQAEPITWGRVTSRLMADARKLLPPS